MRIEFFKWPKMTNGHWKNYALAMAKNGKRPLSRMRFFNHIENKCFSIEDTDNNSFIAGDYLDNTLFVSHWGPHSMRKGVDFIAELLDYDVQVMLSVLPGRMADMLTRLGYHNHGEISVDYPRPQTKVLFSNRPKQHFQGDMTPDKYEQLAINAGYKY